MDEILKLNADEMSGISFDCSCGRRHTVDIKRIIIGKDTDHEIVNIASGYKDGRIFFMADDNTYRAYGSKVEALLNRNGFSLKSHIFHDKHLAPDEKAVGRLLLEMEKETALIISVGSGSLNDMAKLLSYKLEIPYIIAGTAPSMDGYASIGAPIIVDGLKWTYDAVYPHAIIIDLEVVKQAPLELVHAGFGDIIGKFTALADWELSRRLTGEYYCETSVRLVRNALEKCISNVEGIVKRDEKAMKYMAEALIFSGVAMGLVGISRPASGAEHHLAHYWEKEALIKGRDYPLHGKSVGVGSVIISTIYRLMSEEIPDGINVPEPEYITSLLKRVGGPDNPAALGVSREVFRDSILHAMEVRPRFTILRLASDRGRLEELAEILTGRLYG